MNNSRLRSLLLSASLVAFAAYEVWQGAAAWFYYLSETSSELHLQTYSFADQARLLQMAIDLSPSWEMYLSKGKLYLGEGVKRHQEGDTGWRDRLLDVAVPPLEIAAEWEPREAGTYYDLGRAMLLYKYPDMPWRQQALEAFREALQLDPNDRSMLNEIALVLMGQYWSLNERDRRLAKEVVARAFSVNPGSANKLLVWWRRTDEPLAALAPYVTDPDALLLLRRYDRRVVRP